MLEQLMSSGYYEILSILKSGKRMPSEIAKELTKTGMSEKTVYDRFKVLKDLKLIDEEFGKSPVSGRPAKFFYLTPYGKAVLEKLEELETLLQDIAKTPDKPIEEIEKEVLAKKIKPTSEVEEEFKTV
jgi:DNA-binding PadR family transcriptional regulator